MKLVRSQKGQAILEMVLLLVMVLGIWTAVTKALSQKGTFNAIFGQPWERLKNTVEYGIPSNKGNLMGQHPAAHLRHSTKVKNQ